MDAKEEHVTVLAEKTPYQLEDYDVSATIYPTPCFSKHSSENEIGWINESEVGGNTINIGVAHGSLKGVAPDLNDEHFPMTREELDIPDINVWLLGHIHIPWPEKPSPSDKIMYSGIPEPEDMNCTHKGTALIIEFDKGGRKSVEVISTGGNYFDRKHLELHSSQDIQQFEEKIRTGNYQNCVCKLSISGSLDPEDYTRWHNEILPRLKEAFLYLKTDETNLRQKITKESLYEMYPEGSFPQELLSGFLENEDQKALETAFDLFKDIKDEN